MAGIFSANDARLGIPIRELSLAVAGLPVTAAAPHGHPIGHPGCDLLPPVSQFNARNHTVGRLGQQSKPRRLTTGFDLDPKTIDERFLRLACLKSFSGLHRMAWVQRFTVRVQHTYSHKLTSLRAVCVVRRSREPHRRDLGFWGIQSPGFAPVCRFNAGQQSSGQAARVRRCHDPVTEPDGVKPPWPGLVGRGLGWSFPPRLSGGMIDSLGAWVFAASGTQASSTSAPNGERTSSPLFLFRHLNAQMPCND
jgi:hypothetical protein